MDDPFAADLARKGHGADPDADPFAADLARKGFGSAPTVDMGPEARRARAGGAPGPRTSDPEPSGPISTPLPGGLRDESGMAVFPSPRDYGGTPEAHGGAWTNNPEEAGDVMVQTGLLGQGAGALAGKALAGLGMAPRVARIGEAAVGGGTASKTGGGDFTTGAVLGALVPGAAAGASVAESATKLLAKKAENRMVDQAIKDIAGSKETGLSKPTDRRAIANAIEPIKEELRQPDAIKIADTARKDPGKAWEMVQKKVDSLTADRTASYLAVDHETGGVRINDLRRHLSAEVDRLGKDPGQHTERAAIEGMIKDIDETWGQQLAPTVPTIKMREYVTRLQRVAADTMGTLEETRRVQILDHVSGLAKDFLNQHLDDAAKADPGLRPVVEGLREQNRRVSAWLSLEDALKTRAGKLETNNMIDKRPAIAGAAATAAVAAGHFLHSPAAAALAGGIAVAPYVLPPLDRAVTRGLAGMAGPRPPAPMVTPSAISPADIMRMIEASRARQASERDYTQP